MGSERKRFALAMVVLEVVAIPLARTFVGSDFGRWLNSQGWYSPTVGWLALIVLITLNLCLIANRTWERICAGAIALSLTFAACYFVQHPPQKLKGGVGEWLHDDYVGILVPQGVSGTLLGEESYDLHFELENRTSMPMEITKIAVEKYNQNAADALGMKGGLVHSSEYDILKYLKANDQTTYSIPGNEILPLTAIVKVYHSLSGQPSTFEVNLGGKLLQMPAPRRLPDEAIDVGSDALGSVQTATNAARSWNSDAMLIAAFPADHDVLIDSTSRLKYTDVRNWIVNFYSAKLNRVYTVIFRNNGFEAHDSQADQNLDLPDGPVVAPRIGNHRALAIADAANTLCADWKDGPRLQAIKLDGTWRTAWFLPYRSPSGLPVIVDAGSGELLEVHGGEYISRASTTTESHSGATPEPETSQGAADEESLTETASPVLTLWLAADEDSGPNRVSYSYSSQPFVIGNPPGGTAFEFDRIEVTFLHDSPTPDDVTASLIYLSNEEETSEHKGGLHQVEQFFYGDEPITMSEKAKPQTITIEPDRQFELHNVQLLTFSGRAQFTLWLGNQKVITSPVLTLPDRNTLPSAFEIERTGEGETESPRGVRVGVPLLREGGSGI
jgi:hypothetical protein